MKQRTIGRGCFFNMDAAPGKFTAFEEISLEWDTQILEVPDDSDMSASSFDVVLGKKCKLKYAFHSYDANLWALITGGTTTASLSLHYISEELATVPSAPGPFEVTVTNTPLKQNAGATVTIARVYAKDTYGDVTELSQVALAAEVAGESYSVVAATGVFTFAAGDADVVYYIDYWYTGTAGTKVTVAKDDLPVEFEFIGYVDATTLGGLKQQSVHIKKIAPSMPNNWGATRLNAGGAIEIEAGVKGDDIDFYFND